MSDLALNLKQEMSKVARKELGVDLKKTLQELKALRSQLSKLDEILGKLELGASGPVASKRGRPKGSVNRTPTVGRGATASDFSPKKLRDHRKKLGLSAADYGLLCGLSQLSIYHYEQGKTAPRAGSLAAIMAVQEMSHREIIEKLAALKNSR